MKVFLFIVVVFLGLALLIFTTNEFEVFGTRFWGVRKENARREVFEQTQSYVDGKREQLNKYHHEWVNSPEDNKLAIESTIRSSFSGKDLKTFEDDPILYKFLSDILRK